MPILPNPFLCALEAAMPAHSAAAPDLSDPPVAVADPIDGPDIPLADLTGRGFSVAAFLKAMEAPLRAEDLIPVLQVLAGDSFMADIEPIRAAIARH